MQRQSRKGQNSSVVNWWSGPLYISLERFLKTKQSPAREMKMLRLHFPAQLQAELISYGLLRFYKLLRYSLSKPPSITYRHISLQNLSHARHCQSQTFTSHCLYYGIRRRWGCPTGVDRGRWRPIQRRLYSSEAEAQIQCFPDLYAGQMEIASPICQCEPKQSSKCEFLESLNWCS